MFCFALNYTPHYYEKYTPLNQVKWNHQTNAVKKLNSGAESVDLVLHISLKWSYLMNSCWGDMSFGKVTQFRAAVEPICWWKALWDPTHSFIPLQNTWIKIYLYNIKTSFMKFSWSKQSGSTCSLSNTF